MRLPNHQSKRGRSCNAVDERGVTMVRAYHPKKVPADRGEAT
jgi:hypothetical protein